MKPSSFSVGHQREGRADTTRSAPGKWPGKTRAHGAYLVLRGLVLPLRPAGQTVLGRDSTQCDVALVDMHVSKRHAMIYFKTGHFLIEDLGSVNGTYVNGQRVNEAVMLNAGDEIIIRPYTILFLAPQKAVTVTSPAGLLREEGTDRPHFFGQLEVFNIPELIQFLNSTKQDGILVIEDAQRRRASLSFLSGEIVAAAYLDTVGEAAVCALVKVKKGRFDFSSESPAMPEKPLRKHTMTLLFEAVRRLDEDRNVHNDSAARGTQTRKFDSPAD